MRIKKVILQLLLASSFIVLSSCTTFTNKGKSSLSEEKSRTRIVSVDDKIHNNTDDKIDIIADLSFGTDYALSKIENPPKEVEVARDMNKRIASLTGSPSLEKMKEMQDTIDKLISMLATERVEGKQKMDMKDLEIYSLQSETRSLKLAKESEIKKYMTAAQDMAATADAYKSSLDEMNSWGGLGAIWYGVKRIVIKMAWTIGIITVLFFVLRIAAASNPICGAIFSIFEQVVSWFINAIRVIFPKALSYAGAVSKEMYNASSNLLKKIIDNIQNLKQLESKLGHPLTVKELLVELEKSMDASEKVMINKIKSELGY